MDKAYSLGGIAFLLLLAIFDTHADGSDVPSRIPFAHGERLVYTVTYLGITAGEGVLSVSKPIEWNGHRVYPLLSTIQSSPVVSRIYPVNDRVESYFDAEAFYSHRIEVKQQEGHRRREKRVDFDQQRHKATQTKNNQQKAFDVPPRVQDFLSMLYYLRVQNAITPGRSFFVDVHESEKHWKVETRVLGNEKIATPLGTWDTIKMQVVSQFEGMFLTKRDLVLWMTDDCRKIPVKIQSKIAVGSITLALTALSTETTPCIEQARG